MYTYTPTQFTEGTALTNSLVTEYTAANTSILKEISLCNTDVAARTVTVHVVKGGDTAAVKNTILNAVSLAANETKIVNFSRVMPVGYFIQAKADTGAVVSFSASGVVIS